LFPETNTWTWNAKVNGNLNLPHDIAVGAIVEFLDGFQGERTYQFRAADQLGGPALRGLSTVTVQLEPAGTRQEPAYSLVNLRVSKRFQLEKRRVLQLSLDGLNVLNVNAPIAVTYASGPAFNDVTNAVPPRNIRAGVSFSF
jgi:outer membrane receptor protein involved in Fe transport